jgi:hypothetical protein
LEDIQVTESNQPLPAVDHHTTIPTAMSWGTADGFGLIQRVAGLLASSALVPKEYQNNIPNCTIALEIASRIGVSPLMVMQNLYLVHGKPSWSSQFIIAAINGTGKFSPLRFEVNGEGGQRACTAWAIDKRGERLEGPAVSIEMAQKEGWVDRNGSKWKTMPDLMLRYRAATLFGRLYAPEILMGMRGYEEVIDIEIEEDAALTVDSVADKTREKAQTLKKKLQQKQAAPEAMVACPNLDGKLIVRAACAGCRGREGCPAHG